MVRVSAGYFPSVLPDPPCHFWTLLCAPVDGACVLLLLGFLSFGYNWLQSVEGKSRRMKEGTRILVNYLFLPFSSRSRDGNNSPCCEPQGAALSFGFPFFSWQIQKNLSKNIELIKLNEVRNFCFAQSLEEYQANSRHSAHTCWINCYTRTFLWKL